MYLSRIQLRFNNLRPEMLAKWNSAGLMPATSGYGSSFRNRNCVSFCFAKRRMAAFYALGNTAVIAALPVSY